VSDRMWSRNVRARLAREYPRVPQPEVRALVDLWLRVLEGELPEIDLERAVEQQVRSALRAMSAVLPSPRTAERVPALR
jgi:hypothetical protein